MKMHTHQVYSNSIVFQRRSSCSFIITRNMIEKQQENKHNLHQFTTICSYDFTKPYLLWGLPTWLPSPQHFLRDLQAHAMVSAHDAGSRKPNLRWVTRRIWGWSTKNVQNTYFYICLPYFAETSINQLFQGTQGTRVLTHNHSEVSCFRFHYLMLINHLIISQSFTRQSIHDG